MSAIFIRAFIISFLGLCSVQEGQLIFFPSLTYFFFLERCTNGINPRNRSFKKIGVTLKSHHSCFVYILRIHYFDFR
ncbi:hypothetical protein BD560DRAFT_411949 [Blakeslea trispora]|nr:hypothetical protein BD560DRAFT_411949 [Blakeslea trispora]